MRALIVGAGVAGLAVGWKLARAGVDVTVLERARPARAATWAAAGMISPTAESAQAREAERQFARWSADLWPEFAAEVEQSSGAAIGYRRDGALIVALTQEEARAMSGRGAMLSAAETRSRQPMLREDVAGALWDAGEAQVDNRALGTALATAFVRAGGKLRVNEAAVSVETSDGALKVRTPFALHAADKVLVAAGAWSAEIELPERATPPVHPVKGEMIALSPSQGAALPDQVIWGNGVYLVPRNGRLLVGATVEEVGFDTALTDKGGHWLRDHAVALMPSLAEWKVVEHWAGLRPATPDGMPILGETAVKNLFVAAGQYRNGILFAPSIAETMSRLVLGAAAPEIRAFSPQRFRQTP